jgi:hypothetical protein
MWLITFLSAVDTELYRYRGVNGYLFTLHSWWRQGSKWNLIWDKVAPEKHRYPKRRTAHTLESGPLLVLLHWCQFVRSTVQDHKIAKELGGARTGVRARASPISLAITTNPRFKIINNLFSVTINVDHWFDWSTPVFFEIQSNSAY